MIFKTDDKVIVFKGCPIFDDEDSKVIGEGTVIKEIPSANDYTLPFIRNLHTVQVELNGKIKLVRIWQIVLKSEWETNKDKAKADIFNLWLREA